jgi:hypothetical protein
MAAGVFFFVWPACMGSSTRYDPATVRERELL